MNSTLFLILNLALAFYNVGTIWAHEIDIFRSWKLLDAPTFHRVQASHWHKLPYLVLLPAALALIGSIALVWFHPLGSPAWAIWCAVACQLAAHFLTVTVWGRWQAKLSQDPLGSASPYLARILSTHWIRTVLVTAYGLVLLTWAMQVLGVPMKPAARTDQLLSPGARDESRNQSLDQCARCWQQRYTKDLSSEITEEGQDEVSSELWVDLSGDAPQALFCDNISCLLDESDQQGRSFMMRSNVGMLLIVSSFVTWSQRALPQVESPPAGSIHIEITGLRNDKGKVLCALYSSPEGFPKDSEKAIARLSSPIAQEHAVCEFPGVTPGTYAVSVFHDENSNGKLDTNFMGIPREGVGASNNARGHFGPPKFREASFHFSGGRLDLKIAITYL